MSEKINTNKKGETDVKSDATILHTINMLDMRNADIRRANSKELEWDDLQPMGGTNKEEGEYESPEDETEEFRERLKNMKLGKKILQLASLDLEKVA